LTEPKKKKTKHHPGLPDRTALLDYLASNPGKTAKRDVARAFGIKGGAKIALKAMLKELERSGDYDSGKRRREPGAPGRLTDTIAVEVMEIDREEGHAIAHPLDWKAEHVPPIIRIIPQRRDEGELAIGDRALVRLREIGRNEYEARILRRIERAPEKALGVLTRTDHGMRLMPTDRRVKTEFNIASHHLGDAQPGELVLAEILPGRRLGVPSAKVVERLGSADAPKAASLISIYTHGIPVEFPPAAIADAERAVPPTLGAREDLRQVPLVTIDGEDARDFDDAVFAQADDDPQNPGGFHLIVAIADVGWYVRPDMPLDRTARERGNSVYFPDRVVPMLPEQLSNDLCSLRPDEERACMAVHIWIDAKGKKRRHRFVRALMRSAARLTYDQAQATIDGNPGGRPELKAAIIDPLYAAYRALAHARRQRGTLDLDLEERKVELSREGRVERITPRPRFDSHKLIEEFMILANVCAAETIEERRLPCMYRVHEPPDRKKLEALRDVLDSLGYRLARGQVLTPKQFNRILDWAADKPFRHLVNDMILRSQSMAVYSPDNRGHFGLALARYAHFTSPIRRYSDLLVHRALITGLNLGEGALFDAGTVDFESVAEHISSTERRAAAAERDALDRYVIAYLSNRVGASFAGRISGVARFGVFVTLDGIGADGLIPIRSLPQDFYHHDAARHTLRGQRSNRVFTLGDAVEVRLVEAQAVRGSLTFELLGSEERRASPPKRKFDAQTPPHKRYGRPQGGKPTKRRRR
jgi:ribonuclease R